MRSLPGLVHLRKLYLLPIGAFVFSSGDVHSMDEFCLPATK